MFPTLPMLAQSGDPMIVIKWSLALMLGLLVLFIGVNRIRRWFTATQADETETGFTLSDLRRMHKEGKLSKEEYEKAKALVVDRAKAAMNRDQGREEQS